MNDFTDTILRYRSGEMTKLEREAFKRDLLLNPELRKENLFQQKLDQVMKQNLLLESVESDPDLIKAEIIARSDIAAYRDKGGLNVESDNHIILPLDTEVILQKKIAKAEVEMVLSGIDEISEEWVADFYERKADIEKNNDSRKIVEFIKSSDPFEDKVIQMPVIKHRFNRKITYGMAAAVLVLALLMIKPLTPSYTGDSVYREYYLPMETNSFRLRGSSQQVDAKLKEGVNYYLSKEYDKAELAFSELQNAKTDLPEVLLFSGLNRMEQGNFPAAITVFTELLSENGPFVPEAQWYLGLCYIKTGEKEKAIAYMDSLSHTEGIYKEKAHDILSRLER